MHNPGKWHVGADAVSRHPTSHSLDSIPDHNATVSEVFSILRDNDLCSDSNQSSFLDEHLPDSVLYLDAIEDVDSSVNAMDEYVQSVACILCHQKRSQ